MQEYAYSIGSFYFLGQIIGGNQMKDSKEHIDDVQENEVTTLEQFAAGFTRNLIQLNMVGRTMRF